MRRFRLQTHPRLTRATVAAALILLPLSGQAREGVSSASLQNIDTFASQGRSMDFISLEAVFFEFDKATLDERARRTLDRAARYILARPGVYRILVEGHADSRASKDYNYRLADRRAAAVRDYLAAQGVAPALMFVAGLGENFPIDEYWTREGQRRNRHVEVYIMAHPARGAD